MADMNAWNELQQRRGAEAALDALRADMREVCEGNHYITVDAMFDIIGKHTAKYRK